MSDYRVRISVRNARLLRAIEQAGHRPGAQFANAVGISYSGALLPYLNLTRSPLTPDGLLRECAWALCDFLQASPSDLWSDAQLQPLQQNYSSVDLDADSVQSLVSGTYTVDDPLRLASHAQAPQPVYGQPRGRGGQQREGRNGFHGEDSGRGGAHGRRPLINKSKWVSRKRTGSRSSSAQQGPME